MTQIDLRKVALKTREMDIPSIGGKITLRQLPANELVDIQSEYEHLNGEATTGKAALGMYVSLICKSVVSSDDKRYLDTKDGANVVKGLPWGVVVELGTAAMQLNGMVEETKKNN